MSKQQKTKQGVAAIYVVVFTTMLIGIITLSFLRIMLSESGRTINDTLSDSAYNAALAGVEDAKYVIAQYEKQIAGGKNKETSNLVKMVEEADNTDCDIIEKALSDNPDAVVGGEKSIGTDSDTSFQDQAYTCVTLNLEGNFTGVLNSSNPTLVVPLRPKIGTGESAVGSVDDIKKIRLVWTAPEENNAASTNPVQNLPGDDLRRVNNSAFINKGDTNDLCFLGSKGINTSSDPNDNMIPTALNGLRMMFIQSPDPSKNSVIDYYSSNTMVKTTNRGTLMLLASTNGVKELGQDELVNSADKTLNAPIAVECTGGVCSVVIDLPFPRGQGGRDPNNFFLVLNQLYSEPSIKVTVDMLDGSGKVVPFFNVQPIIDSTGRSGDLLRRVEARVGTDNGASLIPTAELATGGSIDKSFYVTKNCIDGTEKCN